MNSNNGFAISILLFLAHAALLILLCGNANYPNLYLMPRDGNFFLGIIFSPLIHNDWSHMWGNIKLLMPCLVIFYFIAKEKSIGIYAILYIGTSVMLWIFGRSGIHIGISGVILSVVFFIIFSGLFSYNKYYLIFALFLITWQFLLIQNFWREYEGVSSDAHFIGAFIGFVTAYFYWKPFKGFFWV